MPYTVWCNDRLVGESDLDYIANTDDHRMGDFVATEFGEQVIAERMAPRKALMAKAEDREVEKLFRQREALPLELRAPDGTPVATDDIEITDCEWLISLAAPLEEDGWRSDLELANDEFLAELGALDDDDFERINADPPPWLDDEDDELDEFDVPDVELGDPTAPPREFPRYQLQVCFPGFLARSAD